METSIGLFSETTYNENEGEKDGLQDADRSFSLENPSESLNTTFEVNGTHVLTRSLIQSGLSDIGYTSNGLKLVYLSLTLSGRGITDCSLISSYIHLQYLDLSHNKIKELCILHCLPNLSSINVSHNKLSKLLDFTPPHNLASVDYSYNEIEEIPDLSNFDTISTLILDGNQITKLNGLSNLHCLTTLSVSNNRIEKIEGLDNLPLKNLNLSLNSITTINNIKLLNLIQTINLSSNQLSSLEGLNGHSYLTHVNVKENEIVELNEIQHLKDLRALRELNLKRNPIQALSDYRQFVIVSLPSLTSLDGQAISIDEKIASINRHCPPSIVTAGHNHLQLTSKAMRKPLRLHYSTLTHIDEPYPMLVLCGPQGSGKGFFSQTLVEEFPNFFGLGVSHTTRPQGSGESHGRDYYFINEATFNRASDAGEFVEICHVNGYMYGLTMAAIEQVAQQGLACVTHMNLEGILTLKQSYFEPRYILTIPLATQVHEDRLNAKSHASNGTICNILADVCKYKEFHQDNPGFFDATINTDNLQEGYNVLRSIVMAYGGMVPETPLTLSLSPSRASTTQQTSTTISPFEVHDTLFPPSVHASNSAPIPILAQPWSRPSSSNSLLGVRNPIKKSLSDQGNEKVHKTPKED